MENTKLLDGQTITYQYEGIGTVRLDFENGLLSFEWIEGPYAGEEGKGHPYLAKEVATDTYLINWLEKEDSSFITVLINLRDNETHSSGLFKPKTNEEMIFFHSAQILSRSIAQKVG